MTPDEKKYKYIGNSTNPEDQNFNKQRYKDMVENRDYEGAFAYASQYPLMGYQGAADDEAERMNKLYNMLREGRRMEFVYKNADENDIPLIEFRNAVVTPGGLEKYVNNPYVEEFRKYKNAIGSGENKIRIVFEPEVQKLFGADWLDWAMPDNKSKSIEKFYEDTGFTSQFLEVNGIHVGQKDGKPFIELNKDNDLANKILLSVNDKNEYGVRIYGVKEDNTLTDPDFGTKTIGYSPQISNLYQLQELYKKGKEAEERASNFGKLKQYSSIIMPLISGDFIENVDQLADGSIKQSEYNSRLKQSKEELIAGLSMAGIENYDVRSDYFNKGGDPTNVELTQKQAKEVLDVFKQAAGDNTKSIQYGITITANNEVGLNISILPKTDSKGKAVIPSCSFTVFGYNTDELQRQINADPKLRSYQELNEMKNLGYSYKDSKGGTYQYDGVNGWIINGEFSNKSENWVVDQIHKDMAGIDMGRMIAMNNISINGNLVNSDRYDLQLKTAAIMLSNDLNNQSDFMSALRDVYGYDVVSSWNTNQITQALFDLKGIDNSVSVVYENNISNPDVYRKLNDIYEIYFNMKQIGMNYINR